MLLQCGNSVETVSKCLNHANIGVTQKHYLRETAQELQTRCNIPWAGAKQDTVEAAGAVIPDFLNPAKPSSAISSTASARAAKRRKLITEYQQRPPVSASASSGA
jgi:hypothetical protein